MTFFNVQSCYVYIIECQVIKYHQLTNVQYMNLLSIIQEKHDM
jgi:hypothetical protein